MRTPMIEIGGILLTKEEIHALLDERMQILNFLRERAMLFEFIEWQKNG